MGRPKDPSAAKIFRVLLQPSFQQELVRALSIEQIGRSQPGKSSPLGGFPAAGEDGRVMFLSDLLSGSPALSVIETASIRCPGASTVPESKYPF